MVAPTQAGGRHQRIRRFKVKQTRSTEISRRRLLEMAGVSAGVTLLAGQPLLANRENAAAMAATANGQNTSFSSLKQIEAGLLNIGYAEAGPANGTPVILLHGWPYDIYSFVDVTPLLAKAGYRVIV